MLKYSTLSAIAMIGVMAASSALAEDAASLKASQFSEKFADELSTDFLLGNTRLSDEEIRFNLADDGVGGSVAGGDADGDGDIDAADASEIARQTSNPLGGDFMILINEFTYTEFKSDDVPAFRGGSSFLQIFQPVIPISMEDAIGPNWILVNRPTLPYFWEFDLPGGPPPGLQSNEGFADISHFSLLGTSTPSESNLLGRGDLVLAGGFSVNIPTGSSSLTNDKWALGPAGVAAYIGEKGILGGLLQTQFDFFDGSTSDYNRGFFQPFYFVNLRDGWQIGGTPLWTFNFDTDEHSIPIGLGVQKTQIFDLGGGRKMPVRFGLEARYFVESPDAYGEDWSLVFQVTPIIPNVIGNLIQGCPAMTVGGC